MKANKLLIVLEGFLDDVGSRLEEIDGLGKTGSFKLGKIW